MLKTLIKSKLFENSKKATGKSLKERRENYGFCAIRSLNETSLYENKELTLHTTDSAVEITLAAGSFGE